MKRIVILSLIAVLALSTAAFAPAPFQLDDATVYVIHGINGADLGADSALPVDVSVNGACVLTGFEFKDIAGPLTLPAGEYDIQVRLAADDPCTGPLAIDVMGLPLNAGENTTIIAHLDAAGAPTASKFNNDVSAPSANRNGRLAVHHTAAAPSVDVTLEYGKSDLQLIATIEDLANGEQAGPFELRGGMYVATIFPAGGDDAVLGPATLGLKPRRLTNVFAVGSLENGLDIIVQRIALSRTAPATASVYVVHGVPGLTVDVYVNGGLALPGFTPGTITSALNLPPGTYDIEIYPEGVDPTTNPPAIAGSADVVAGLNASLVAHLAEDGSPTLSVFVNDLANLTPGSSRLVVRHTAAVEPVDVSLSQGGSLVGTIEDLANPAEASVDVPGGMYQATIALSSDPSVTVGPVDLRLRQNWVQVVYAVGSLGDGSFDLLVQSIRSDVVPVTVVNSLEIPGRGITVYEK